MLKLMEEDPPPHDALQTIWVQGYLFCLLSQSMALGLCNLITVAKLNFELVLYCEQPKKAGMLP
jgi:hypothetical protein